MPGFDGRDFTYEVEYLRNGSDKEMDVNGSSTARTYQYTPTSDIEYIDRVTLLLQDEGDMDVDRFGSRSDLNNGLIIEYQTQGTAAVFANLQDNGDIATAFSTLWVPPEDDTFLEEEDTVVATYIFDPPIEMSSDTSDYFRAVVRDNLNGLNYLRISVTVRREV